MKRQDGPALDARTAFRRDVLVGLSSERKTLPCKYFYDERGSRLFEEICELEEYYPTVTEQAILERNAASIASALGSRVRLIELGSGASRKTEVLLSSLPDLVEYVPIDISDEMLGAAAERVAALHPGLVVRPVIADYSAPLEIPPDPPGTERRAIFFSGSTIGNFEPPAAELFLKRIARVARPGGVLLIGVDLVKEHAVLEAAYDDSRGVTAAFNKNLLVRINQELGGDFDFSSFTHRAFYDADAGRIEMHLVSEEDQSVEIAGRRFAFRRGETICTEYSYKYTLDGFRGLAESAGFQRAAVWTDPRSYFSLQLYVVPRPAEQA